MTRSARWIFVLLAPTLVACSGPEQAEQTGPRVVTGVKTASVSVESVPGFYETVGTVRSRTTTVISARTMGHVSRVLVSEGDRVRVGQALVEIDNRDAAVQVRRAEARELETRESLAALDKDIAAAEFARAAAEANRKLAASTFERYRALHDRRSVSDQEFDEVQAKLNATTAEVERASAMLESLRARRNQALAQIDQARAEKAGADLYLNYTSVVSPMNGVVTRRSVEAGMVASPGVPLVTVEDNSAYRLEAQVPESQSGAIRNGDRIRIQLETSGSSEMEGRVTEIVPAADPSTRTTVVKIDLPSNAALRSGSFGRAVFSSGERPVIQVARSLVTQRGQLTSVYVLDGNVVRQRLIRLGKVMGDRVEVLSGLESGDLLIVEPREGLADGMQVRQ